MTAMPFIEWLGSEMDHWRLLAAIAAVVGGKLYIPYEALWFEPEFSMWREEERKCIVLKCTDNLTTMQASFDATVAWYRARVAELEEEVERLEREKHHGD